MPAPAGSYKLMHTVECQRACSGDLLSAASASACVTKAVAVWTLPKHLLAVGGNMHVASVLLLLLPLLLRLLLRLHQNQPSLPVVLLLLQQRLRLELTIPSAAPLGAAADWSCAETCLR